MNVSEAIVERRAVKWYDPDHQMPEEHFRRLMEHALLSPTAFNVQNWRFVRVTDPAQREAIRAADLNQPLLVDQQRHVHVHNQLKTADPCGSGHRRIDPVETWARFAQRIDQHQAIRRSPGQVGPDCEQPADGQADQNRFLWLDGVEKTFQVLDDQIDDMVERLSKIGDNLTRGHKPAKSVTIRDITQTGEGQSISIESGGKVTINGVEIDADSIATGGNIDGEMLQRIANGEIEPACSNKIERDAATKLAEEGLDGEPEDLPEEKDKKQSLLDNPLL